MNASDRDEIKRHAEAIAERSRQTAHALDVTAGALDNLFEQAIEAQAHPGVVVMLYASKALLRGRDALKANMVDAVKVYALASHETPVQATDPELMEAMRCTAAKLHVLLEQSEDTARLLTSDVWKGRDKT
jgi:hypothetical protein